MVELFDPADKIIIQQAQPRRKDASISLALLISRGISGGVRRRAGRPEPADGDFIRARLVRSASEDAGR